MERSREIFLEISSASRRVNIAANEYAKREGLFCVPRSHFQLEADMRRIAVACDTLASILARSSLPDDPAFDIRLQDWISSNEPCLCLDTLRRMEKILQKDAFSWMNFFVRGRGTTSTQDKIKEAADHLASCKGCFHFLFTSETWNSEGVRQRKDISQSRDYVPEGPDIFDQRSSVAVPASIDITVSDTSIHQRKHASTRERREMIVDVQLKKKKNGDPPSVELRSRIVGLTAPGVSLAQNLEEILRWLDGLNCSEKQDVTLLLRQPDTCKWLLDTPQYKMWRGGEIPCLWLHGKPGAGKSVLASSVIDSLEEVRQEGGIFVFFYCDFRNERSTSASEVLRSILSQLLRQLRERDLDPGSLIDDLVHAKQRSGATRNNTNELARFASRAAKLSNKKPLVVVDALDECKDVETLLGGLSALKGYVQLFTTSRPLQVIKDGLSGFPFVSMDDMMEELSADIVLHVTRELDARRRLRVLGAEIKAEIRSVLCRKAGGMFRWVQCSIDTLNRCVTLKEVQTALSNLPEGLDETYERILLAIDIKTREGQLALRALVWLVAALRPLHIDELTEGLSIDLGKRALNLGIGPMHKEALLDACGSLVTYSEETNIIILSHFSVKEYLVSESTCIKLPQYHISWEYAHLQLARACMCYISICLECSQGSDGFSNSDASSEHRSPIHPMSHPLLDYVLKDAFNHFRYFGSRIGSVLDDIKVLEGVIERHSWVWDTRYSTAPQFAGFAGYIAPHWPRHTHDLVLYILVAFAPDWLLHAYLPRPALKLKKGTNPLVYAAYFNKHEQAQTLLSRGAKLDCIDDYFQALPIEVALRYGHYSMVTLFVAKGSTVSPQIFAELLSDRYGVVPSSVKMILLQTDDFAEAVNDPLHDLGLLSLNSCQSFLIEADVHGQDLIAILRRIIQVVPGRGHVSVPQYFASILHTTPYYLDEEDVLEIVKLLVGHAVDPLGANFSGKTTLYMAVQRVHVSVAQYLISLGARLPPDILVVALKLWSSEWQIHTGAEISMFRFLVENGADLHVRTEAGDSVFHVALKSFREDRTLEIAKLLVGYGCDPLVANSSGKTSFHIAVERDYTTVARYLLSLGAPPPHDILLTLDMHDIRRAAQRVCFLIENGADVQACTEIGDSVLHVVLKHVHQDDALAIAILLVDNGCDPLKADSSGKISLHIALEQGHISVARYLHSLGVPLPPDIFLALDLSGVRMTAEMVHFLVENGADVHACTRSGDSVLHIVLECCCYHEEQALETAKFLVGHGCDPLKTNSSGKTPLHIAIKHNHVSVTRYLHSLGVPLPPDIFGTLVLRNWRMAEMVRFLVENGADVHARGYEDPVLHVAVEFFYEDDALEIAKFLVGYGCDPLEVDSSGRTPLHIAVQQTHISVARYLLSCGVPLPPDILLTLGSGVTIWETRMTQMVRCLVENGADVHACTETGTSVLHIALEHVHQDEALEMAELLIGYGCDLLEANSSGKTSLHIALERCHIPVARYLHSLGVPLPPDILLTLDLRGIHHPISEVVRFLLENGADVHARNAVWDSVFHVTLKSCHDDEALKIAELLIGHGCDFLEANFSGKTPLHIAIEQAHVSVAQYLLSLGVPLPPDILLTLDLQGIRRQAPLVRFLVENGADVHARNGVGDSVLHVVLESLHHDAEVIELLVDCGCDPFEANSRGKTPLQIAVERGLYPAEDYLRSLGACDPDEVQYIPHDRDVGPSAVDQE